MDVRNPITVDLDHLHDHPHNAHITTRREREKIKNNIRRTRHYPALVVRELTDQTQDYPGEPGHYQILDGHQRRLIFADLLEEGLDEFANILCDDWSPLTDEETLIALATLNSWGDNVPRRRAELLHAITGFTDLKDASQILPESERQITDALKLLKQPLPDIKRLIDETEQPDLITLTFVVGDEQKAAVARFTAAAQLFGAYYGASLSDIHVKNGGDRKRVAVMSFQIQNAAQSVVDQALKRAGAGLPPGTRNKRGRSLEQLASQYLAISIEQESQIPLAKIERDAAPAPEPTEAWALHDNSRGQVTT